MAHQSLPSSLPVPEDDAALIHITTALPYSLPSITLPSTRSTQVNLSSLTHLTIIFLYPRTAAPGETVQESWSSIPGARGCTPQACSFRDTFADLEKLGVKTVYGISTQSSDYQREVKERLGLGYELLSDEKGELVEAMSLPTFEYGGIKLVKRMTFAIEQGKLIKVWYPVFPPDKSAAEVVTWLEQRAKSGP